MIREMGQLSTEAWCAWASAPSTWTMPQKRIVHRAINPRTSSWSECKVKVAKFGIAG
jgi:hypothetical protein